MGIIKPAGIGIGLIGFIGLLNGCTEVLVPGAMTGGGEYFHWFEGQRFGFFKADIGNASEDVTQSFKCE
jgi:hypothetical protein